MRVFIAGATGAIGKPLVRRLGDAGHEVVGTGATPSKVADLDNGIVLDVLDREATVAAVAEASPDVVIHEATGLANLGNPRRMAKEFELTNRLRTEGTDNLLAAAREAGARRFIAQSFAGWPFAREGGPVKDEGAPMDENPPKAMVDILGAIKHLEKAVTEAEGIEGLVLRYGGFYGPGTGLAADGAQSEAVRKRQFPIVAEGAGVWSLIHIEDAASATAAAVERGDPGLYNVTDDEPARVRDWLPALAETLGAKPPRRVPAWLARLVGGQHSVVMLNEIRGASNEKAKRELGWTPRYPSWREGFKTLA